MRLQQSFRQMGDKVVVLASADSSCPQIKTKTPGATREATSRLRQAFSLSYVLQDGRPECDSRHGPDFITKKQYPSPTG